MTKKDVLELKRRFSKDCSISRLAGCYVDCNKNKVLTLNENFLNLQEDEFYKFLDIAKKTLSGTVGNNILELSFPSDEEEPGGKQQFLRGIRESNLENDELLDRLYDLIIENYAYTGNYLILVYRDNYDIMTRTKDNLKLDESEDVFEYILVSICPVDLSKPGLGYRIDENRIGARIRDWVVGAPDLGFIFPAFSDRSSDIHKVDYYTKDPKSAHPEFIEEVLGCTTRRTAYQQRETLSAIVKKAYGNEEKAAEAYIDIQESINARIEEREDDPQVFTAPLYIDEKVLAEVLEENNIPEDPARFIRDRFSEELIDEEPTADTLLDSKAIKQNAPIKREKELIREVVGLKNQLKDYGIEPDSEKYLPGSKKAEEADSDDAYEALEAETAASDDSTEASDSASRRVVLRVSKDKAEKIHREVIDDRRYILIPVDDDDEIIINGEEID